MSPTPPPRGTRRSLLPPGLLLVTLAAGGTWLFRCDSAEEPAADPEGGPPTTAPAEGTAAPLLSAPPEAAPLPDEQFTWEWQAAGAWTHVSSESGEYRLPEVMCGGVALLDHDLDGDLDVFLATGGVWPDLQPDAPAPGHALLRNDGDFKFVNVAREAGVFGTPDTYVLGCIAGDYDGDGDPDLYLTAFGENVLYRNEGDGTFRDVTREAGVAGGDVFSSSACWLDADLDGHLDLYVVNYVAYTHEINRAKDCGVPITGFRDFCSPREFDGVQDYLFHNNGDGTFREIALEIGLNCPEPISKNGKGLGVVATDVDGDGDQDLYVANDSTANLLFLNDGKGHFKEDAIFSGCAYSEDGMAQAGMGTESGDFDGDGDMDLWVVHLDFETNALYRNVDGKGFFVDDNQNAGLSSASAGQVGFGTDLFDYDHDGRLDLIITNGHVLVHVGESRGTLSYRQRDQLFHNQGEGRFEYQKPERAGHYFDRKNAGRGLATGDLDGDGDLDVVINVRDERPAILRNNHSRVGQRGQHALILQLVGTSCNRAAVGARVTVHVGDRTLTEEVRAGHSYCSSSDIRLHFGLGDAGAADAIVVRWPGGGEDRFEAVAADQVYRVPQGGKLEAIRAFR